MLKTRRSRTSSSSSATTSARPNISAYIDRLVGYRTPNIDRIAKEGMMFTDYYAENSCTAGRSSFITGQICLSAPACPRSASPAPPVGLQDRDITIAQALKPLGYATGQFGKNHLGDRDEYLPTNARLRRVLRQPLPPQRRGGARAALLAEGRHGLRQGQLAARRAPGVRRRQDRGHRPAQPQAHGDDRRRDDGRRDRLHEAAGQGRASRSSPG